ncbi:hypothetical protein QJS04_geneDACA002022 [Acorus gramineus]|uniref:F-box domain-containing protein n=1 Tax=Acorus gramineus TaxID=55184 RepID=A0AAV9A9S4_ACOGR|nr:hypothetical protein QJS04_geneDACA002022 [Acorus gramineus]
MCSKMSRSREGQELLLLDPPQEPRDPPPPPPTTTRPWSKPPLPFVKHLLRRLQIPDYIRFSSVCHQWHISKKRAQTLPSQQLPWLLLPRNVDEPSITFYSLSEDSIYRIPIPHIVGSECVSAVRGWLLFKPNLSASPAIQSRFILNPLLDILHEFPNNSLAPPIISATAIMDSPSPNNPQGFWVFFAGGRSILFWNPVENVKFKKVIDHDEFWLEILDMTAEGEKLYYITDDLDLFEYDHCSNSTKMLIQNPLGDDPAQPSLENNHFLMVACVGEERKILMAVVVYDLEDSSEKVKGVDYGLDSEIFNEMAKGVNKPLQPQTPSILDRLLCPSLTTRRWSKLPLRFVKHLLCRLQVPDYIRFSSVCHAWHISKKRAQTQPSQQLPWLLLPRQPDEPIISYYSLSENCTYRLRNPYISGYDCIASTNGWLLFECVTTQSLFLADPLSKHGFPIPITNFKQHKINCVLFAGSSSRATNGIRILIASGDAILVWDPVRKVQSKVEVGFNVLGMVDIADYVYILREDLELVGYDLRTDELMDFVLDVPGIERPQPSTENDYFLVITQTEEEEEEEDILMAVVVYFIGSDGKPCGVERMELYVWCDEMWVRVRTETIEDKVLFLGVGGCSVSVRAGKAGVRARVAYVVPERERLKSLSSEVGRDLKWVDFDLETGKVSYE